MGKTFYFCDGQKEGCPRTNCWHINRNSESCHYSSRLRDSLTLKATGHTPLDFFQFGDDSFEDLHAKRPVDFFTMQIEQKANELRFPRILAQIPYVRQVSPQCESNKGQIDMSHSNAERDSYDDVIDLNGWYEFW